MTSGLLHKRDSAAAYVREKHKIPCTAGYLAKLASVGGGPAYLRLDNRWVLYAEDALDAWALTRLSGPIRRASEQSLAVAGDELTWMWPTHIQV
jgi:hypothetical protein